MRCCVGVTPTTIGSSFRDRGPGCRNPAKYKIDDVVMCKFHARKILAERLPRAESKLRCEAESTWLESTSHCGNRATYTLDGVSLCYVHAGKRLLAQYEMLPTAVVERARRLSRTETAVRDGDVETLRKMYPKLAPMLNRKE